MLTQVGKHTRSGKETSSQELGEMNVELESELNATTYEEDIEFREVESRFEDSTSRAPSLNFN